MIVPAAATPRAISTSPSGWTIRCRPIGGTSTGNGIGRPSTVVPVSISATSRSARGTRHQRRNAARLRPSATSSPAPAATKSKVGPSRAAAARASASSRLTRLGRALIGASSLLFGWRFFPFDRDRRQLVFAHRFRVDELPFDQDVFRRLAFEGGVHRFHQRVAGGDVVLVPGPRQAPFFDRFDRVLVAVLPGDDDAFGAFGGRDFLALR